MILEKLILSNFRNYLQREFEFGSGVSVLVGPNTVGKTNVLEAIYLLAVGGSFRDGKIEEMVNWGAELGRVQGIIEQTLNPKSQPMLKLRPAGEILNKSQSQNSNVSKDQVELEVVVTRGVVQSKRVVKRKYLVNGVSRSRAKFVGSLLCVSFRPEDMRIVEGSPARRRVFWDELLSQVDPEYARALGSYTRGLRRRNKVLEMIREGRTGRAALTFWDQLVLKNGELVQDGRRELVEFFNLGESYSEFGLGLDYYISVMSEKRLSQYSQQEVAAGYTLVGPHRDDFVINSKFEPPARLGLGQANHKQIQNSNTQFQKGRNLAIYGSRGEQRMGVLWLKLMAMEYVEKKMGQRPVLLLDDILSELDSGHRKMILAVAGKQQTIVTSADENDLEDLGNGWERIDLK